MIDENKLIEELKQVKNKRADNKREYELMSDFINIVDNQPKINEWISVKDRLPTREECIKSRAEFLITDVYKDVYDAYYNRIKDIWTDGDNYKLNAIAWQPLPSKYEG